MFRNSVQRYMRLLPQGALLLLFLGSLNGCQQGGQQAAGPDIAGHYVLTKVDGQPVPCTVKHDGHTLTIHSGSMDIRSDGTCLSRMVFTPPKGQEVTREVTADYKRNGSTLIMRWKGAGLTRGSVKQDTFTMNNEGMLLAYRK